MSKVAIVDRVERASPLRAEAQRAAKLKTTKTPGIWHRQLAAQREPLAAGIRRVMPCCGSAPRARAKPSGPRGTGILSIQMSAIVNVRTASGEAFAAFLDVVQDDAIDVLELGQGSGIYQVVFISASVQPGTGFETLQRIMDEHSPGAAAALKRVDFG